MSEWERGGGGGGGEERERVKGKKREGVKRKKGWVRWEGVRNQQLELGLIINENCCLGTLRHFNSKLFLVCLECYISTGTCVRAAQGKLMMYYHYIKSGIDVCLMGKGNGLGSYMLNKYRRIREVSSVE